MIGGAISLGFAHFKKDWKGKNHAAALIGNGLVFGRGAVHQGIYTVFAGGFFRHQRPQSVLLSTRGERVPFFSCGRLAAHCCL